jgi:hypothetical protein
MKHAFRYLGYLARSATRLVTTPGAFVRQFVRLDAYGRGNALVSRRPAVPARGRSSGGSAVGKLEAYFEQNQSGRGIWKWRHYFDLYDRHFARFVGREVRVLEIGIYSGGSLAMWRHYFGDKCRVYGVDIEEACRAYEDQHTRIFVGDQGDRSFWARVRQELPEVDIVIDDGGHLPEQQMTTLEETMLMLAPGGVYFCEDVVGSHNIFSGYVQALADGLHRFDLDRNAQAEAGHPICRASGWQSEIEGIHVYPLVVVIEKRHAPVTCLSAPRHGTEWQPFFDNGCGRLV